MLHGFAFLERGSGKSLFFRLALAITCIVLVHFAFVGNPPRGWSRRERLGLFGGQRGQTTTQFRHGNRGHHGHATFILVLRLFLLLLLLLLFFFIYRNWTCIHLFLACTRHRRRHVPPRHGHGHWHGRHFHILETVLLDLARTTRINRGCKHGRRR
jgi:hypothetical protein